MWEQLDGLAYSFGAFLCSLSQATVSLVAENRMNMSFRSRVPNEITSLDAGMTVVSDSGRHWPGTSEFSC